MSNTAKTYMQIHYSGGRKEEILLAGLNEYVVGRLIKKAGTPANDVGLDDQFVSRKQCRIFWSGSGNRGNWVVEDLGSSNGTKLNGFPVLGPTPIPDNGEIYVGTSRLILSPNAAGFSPLELMGQDKKTGEAPAAAGEGTMLFTGTPTFTAPAAHGVADDLSEATMLAMPRRPAAPPPKDGPTMVLGRSGGDPTLQRPVEDSEMTLLRMPGKATEAILELIPGQDDATITHPVDENATLLSSREQATIQAKKMPPRKDEATINLARSGEGTQTLASPAKSATILPGQRPRPPVSEPTALGTAMHAPELDTESTISDRRGLATRMVTGNLLMTQSLNSGLIHELLDHNFIDQRTAVDLLQRAQQTGQPFFTILAREGASPFMEQIYQLVAQKFQFAVIKDEQVLSNEAQSTPWLPFNRALDAGMVLLQPKDPNRNRYATIDPFNLTHHDWVVRCGGKPADKVIVPPNCFNPTLNRLREKENQSDEEVGVAIDITADEEVLIREQISEVAVPQMVNFFLHRAHVQRASDIHIEPTEDLLLVRNRVDGILHGEISLPMAFHPEVVSRLKILSGMDVAEKRRPQDGRFGVLIRDNPIDIRVSSYPTVYGEKFVLRLLDKNALRPSIEALGLLARDLRLIKDKLNAPFGLIVISGPTGSGKTTTLYSCLSSMDKESRNVLTVEDPVEYRLKGVHQMQVNHKIGLTFASGLRTMLRQDPDVIMVGEMRDAETANMAVQASLTGHIVFSTIHANDSVGVVTRLLDMGLEPFLVATSVSMAIAQRLVRKVCGHCKTYLSGGEILELLTKDGISSERLNTLGILIDEDMEYVQGAGCRHCRNTGYTRRQPVFELFEMTDQARSMIMAPDFNADVLRQHAKNTGMTTLISHGLKLVEEEITTFQEVIRVLGE